MKQVFLKKEGNPSLLLFFAGWGADERLFDRPVASGYDYMLCFDYRTLDFDYSLLDGYEKINLIAWSMGVWVAGSVLSGTGWPLAMSVAVNGTLYPIDDRRGIPRDIFEGTLQGFSEKTLVRFRRRMCGTAEQVKEFLSHDPYRPLAELEEELAALKGFVEQEDVPDFPWSHAIAGTQDRIFPFENQQNAWKEIPVHIMDVPHYDAQLFDRLLSEKEEVWIRH